MNWWLGSGFEWSVTETYGNGSTELRASSCHLACCLTHPDISKDVSIVATHGTILIAIGYSLPVRNSVLHRAPLRKQIAACGATDQIRQGFVHSHQLLD